jgi:hypothetical protein
VNKFQQNNQQKLSGGFMKDTPKKYAYPIDPVRKKRIDEMGKKHNKSIKQILDKALDDYLDKLEKTDPV